MMPQAGLITEDALDALWTKFEKAAEAKSMCVIAMDNGDIQEAYSLKVDLLGKDAEHKSDLSLWKTCLVYNGENRELGAALELKRAQAARALLASGASLSKVIWIDAATTTARVGEYAKLPEKTIAFLREPQNREQIRGRFPDAALTDDVIDPLLEAPNL